MCKISVIVPVYNCEDYLEESIKSILNQSFQDFEIIILDDCSTDNSIEIIEKYRNEPKVSHIILNSQNSGSTFIQWNKGFEYAKGKYIWIAESDDVADYRFLEKLIEAIYKYNPVLAFSNSHFIDSNSNIIKYKAHKNLENSTYFNQKHIYKNKIIRYNIYCRAVLCYKTISF